MSSEKAAIQVRRVPAYDSSIHHAGRWRPGSSESSRIASWSGASLSFAFTGSLLRIVFGPQTQQRDYDAGSLPTIAWTVDEGEVRCTHVKGAEAVTLFELGSGDDISANGKLKSVYIVLSDWASEVEIEAFELEKDARMAPPPRISMATRHIRTLFIGDSITSGFAMAPADFPRGAYDAYPHVFKREIESKDAHVAVEVEVIAYPAINLANTTDSDSGDPKAGMVTKYWQTSPWDSDSRWTFEAETGPEIVFISLGVNDDSQPVPDDEFLQAMKTFILALTEQHNKTLRHVVVISPIVPHDIPEWYTAAPYEPALAALSVPLPNVQMHHVPTFGWLTNAMTFDSTHPSPAGHAELGRRLAEWAFDAALAR